MKTFIFFAALIIASTYVGQAQSQTNWVVCENIVNGQVQSFPDRCPSGWVFISY